MIIAARLIRDRIVGTAVDRISTHPDTDNIKAALKNRQALLMAIGARLNPLSLADGNFRNNQPLIDRMKCDPASCSAIARSLLQVRSPLAHVTPSLK